MSFVKTSLSGLSLTGRGTLGVAASWNATPFAPFFFPFSPFTKLRGGSTSRNPVFLPPFGATSVSFEGKSISSMRMRAGLVNGVSGRGGYVFAGIRPKLLPFGRPIELSHLPPFGPRNECMVF